MPSTAQHPQTFLYVAPCTHPQYDEKCTCLQAWLHCWVAYQLCCNWASHQQDGSCEPQLLVVVSVLDQADGWRSRQRVRYSTCD